MTNKISEVCCRDDWGSQTLSRKRVSLDTDPLPRPNGTRIINNMAQLWGKTGVFAPHTPLERLVKPGILFAWVVSL